MEIKDLAGLSEPLCKLIDTFKMVAHSYSNHYKLNGLLLFHLR